MGPIPTKLHQFLISSFRGFVRTDAQTDTQTDAAKIPNNTSSRHSWRTGKNATKSTILGTGGASGVDQQRARGLSGAYIYLILT